MLKETMLAIRVTDMEYAPDICRLLKAAETDLKMAGVIIDGICSFTITETTDQATGETTIEVSDNSTITDDQVKTAMITFVGARGNYAGMEERAALEASYDLQRRQLANARGYTDFLDGAEGTETAGTVTETTEPGAVTETTEPGTEEET